MKTTPPTTSATKLLALAFAALLLGQPAQGAAWNSTAGGNWSDTTATGWNGPYPDAVDAVATINTNITANQIMNLDVPAIVGSLLFGDSTGTSTWTIQDTGALGTALTFDVSAGNASLTSVGGANTISVPLALNDFLDVTATSNLTLSGAISGSGIGFTKSGAGTLILSGADANTYTGLTTVSTGTLTLNKTSGSNAIGGNLTVNGGTVNYGTGPVKSNQIADGATVTLGGGNFTTQAGTAETITNLTVNSGAFTHSSGGTAGSVFQATGTTTLAGGSFTVAGRSNSFITGSLVISGGTNLLSANGNGGGTTLTVDGLTINQPISGAFTALAMSQTASEQGTNATLNLLGDLTFNGDPGNTNSVAITATNSGGSQNLIRLTNVAGAQNRTFTIGDGAAAVDLIIQPRIVDGAAAGSGITKAGDGTLRLDGLNAYTGATVISGGVLLDNLDVAQSSQTGTTSNGGTVITGLTDTSGLVVGQAVTGSGVGSGRVITQIISPTSVRMSGGAMASGTVSITFGAGNAIPGGLGTTGGISNIVFNGGVLGLGSGNFSRGLGTAGTQVQWTGDGGFAAFGADRTVNLGGAGATVTWDSGSFVPNGGALILGASNADATVDFQNAINLNGATRTVQVDDGSADIDGILSGELSNGGLTKTGAGTLELTADNTYTGATSVNAGTLLVNGSLAATAVTVDNDAVLGGSGILDGPVLLQGASVLSPGNSVGALTINDNVTLSDDTTLAMEINGIADYDQIVLGGGASDFTLTGGNITLSLTLGYTPDIGDSFTLVNNTTAGIFGGAFANLTPGGTIVVGGHTFQANNFGAGSNDLILTVIPEPQTAFLLALGVTALLRRRTKPRRLS